MDTSKTKELFASLIERPPITDQLLQRPPFRFLLDVINATIKNTGFLKDVFEARELNASSLSDKTAKTSFFKKFIRVLNDDGSLDDIKASKIIAGKEPEKTNLLLQKFAIDAADYRSSNKKKSKVSNGRKTDATGDHKVVEKVGEVAVRNRRVSNDEFKLHKARSRHSSASQDKHRSKERKHKTNTTDRRSSIDEGHFGGERIEETSDKVEAITQNEQEPSGTAKTDDSGIADDIGNESDIGVLMATPIDQTRLMSSSGRPKTSMGRPGTAMARPAPPKLKKKHIEMTEAKPDVGAETSTVITDERKEDLENFITETDDRFEYSNLEKANAAEMNTEEHGGLVRKILETKKELEAGLESETADDDFIVFGETEQKKTKAQVTNLQELIQQITRRMHPLAQFFDTSQENVESMLKEMEDWRAESRKNMAEARQKMPNSNSRTEALMLRLNELDQEIRDTRAALAKTKASCIANDQLIQSLMSNL